MKMASRGPDATRFIREVLELRKGRRNNSVVKAYPLNISPEKCTALFFPLNEGPFTRASRELLSGDKNKSESAKRVLGHYYENFRNASLADVMVLQPLVLRLNPWAWELSSPVEAAVCPWNSASLLAPNLISEQRRLALDSKNRTGDLPKLENLITSIKQRGYQPHDGFDGDVTVERLVNGPDERFHVINGVHRASVLAALGYKEIRVRVVRIVRREDASFWPKVKGLVFSEEASLAFFDNFFARGFPPQS